MTLNSQQAFKAGFLRECAAQGLTREETLEVVMSATELIKSGGITDWLGSLVSKPVEQAAGAATGAAGSAFGNVANTLTQGGLAAAILGPPALGMAAGYGASRLTDVDDDDVKTVKKRELISEYRRQAARLRQRRRTYKLPV